MDRVSLKKWLFGTPMVMAWGVTVVVGMFFVFKYQMTPAAQAAVVPARWPEAVSFPRSINRSTLVMTLHPQCPCSRASLHELNELMSRSEGRLDAHVLFVEPKDAPAGWLDGTLWQTAKAIPGVTISIDKDGNDAARFGAATSGTVLVYDVNGVKQFSGGITDGRGHEGDNIGLDSVLGLVRVGKAEVSATPVYGCSLGICHVKGN